MSSSSSGWNSIRFLPCKGTVFCTASAQRTLGQFLPIGQSIGGRPGNGGSCCLIDGQYHPAALSGSVVFLLRNTGLDGITPGVDGPVRAGIYSISVSDHSAKGFTVYQRHSRLDVRRLAGVGQLHIIVFPLNRGSGLADGEWKFCCTLERCAGDGGFCRIPSVDIVSVGYCIVIPCRQRLPVHRNSDSGCLRCAGVGQSQVSGQSDCQHSITKAAFPNPIKAAFLCTLHQSTGKAGFLMGRGTRGMGVLTDAIAGMTALLHHDRRIVPRAELIPVQSIIRNRDLAVVEIGITVFQQIFKHLIRHNHISWVGTLECTSGKVNTFRVT